MKDDSTKLSLRRLDSLPRALQRYRRIRKFRAAVRVLIAINRMGKLAGIMRAISTSSTKKGGSDSIFCDISPIVEISAATADAPSEEANINPITEAQEHSTLSIEVVTLPPSPEHARLPPPELEPKFAYGQATRRGSGIALPTMQCGYMKKLGQQFPKTWKKRFFVLELGHLTYYASESSPGSGIGKEKVGQPLTLRGYVVTNPIKDRLLLTTNSTKGREMVLKVKENGMLFVWLTAFAGHINFNNQRELRRTSFVAMPLATAVPRLHSGFMSKQGQINRTWKKRFFVLDKGELAYFTSESSPGSGIGKEQVGEAIVLFHYKVSTPSMGKILLSKTTETGRELLLVTEDASKHEEWVRALGAHINYLDSLASEDEDLASMGARALSTM